MDGEGYRSIDEGIALAKLIVAAGADALHVDAGCHENWPNAMPPAGMQQMTLQSRSAKIIRSVVDVPVMTHAASATWTRRRPRCATACVTLRSSAAVCSPTPTCRTRCLPAGRTRSARASPATRAASPAFTTARRRPARSTRAAATRTAASTSRRRRTRKSSSSSAPALPAAWRRSTPNRPATRSRSGRRAATSAATPCAPASRFSSATCTA